MAIRDGLANELRKKRKRLNVKRTSTGTGTRSVLLTLRITAAAPIPTRRLLYSIAVYVYVHSVRRQLGTLSDEFQFSKKLPSTTNAYSIFVTARFPKTHYVRILVLRALIVRRLRTADHGPRTAESG